MSNPGGPRLVIDNATPAPPEAAALPAVSLESVDDGIRRRLEALRAEVETTMALVEATAALGDASAKLAEAVRGKVAAGLPLLVDVSDRLEAELAERAARARTGDGESS